MTAAQIVVAVVLIGVTTFISTALLIWRPRIDDLTRQLKEERTRRIEAESNSNHTMYEFHWGTAPTPPASFVDTEPHPNQEIINLTWLDEEGPDEQTNL